MRPLGKMLRQGAVFLLAIMVIAVSSSCFGAAGVKEPVVKLGIDNIDQHLNLFLGKRVGLITNATGINSQYQSTVDVLYAKTNLVALYSPEHGIRGAVPAGDTVSSQNDAKTGLPVNSLYGNTKKPTPEMLKDIDVLVFDIQDVGARSYTYIYTMAYAMQSAKENGKTFVVLDRPNPIGGVEVEGGLMKDGYESFIGLYPIPIRHGMTVGELAQLFNKEFGINCDLQVVPMTGWKRSMYYSDTGLPWVMTSPNIPTPDTAITYPCTGVFGGTNVSEGVGTTRPFDFVGATWINADALAERMNSMNLPGVVFRPAYYQPKYGKFIDQQCSGVQLHITDRKAFRPVKTGMALLYTIREMNPDFAFETNEKSKPMIDLVTGDDSVRVERYTLDELMTKWDAEATEFKAKAKKYYLY
ncbi:MAG: hypothetical protein H6Q74_2893 [Firmicutes bacterium]|nr:hypothetical protein [Bacillota bacterium]